MKLLRRSRRKQTGVRRRVKEVTKEKHVERGRRRSAVVGTCRKIIPQVCVMGKPVDVAVLGEIKGMEEVRIGSIRVHEVGAGLDTAHGSGGAVVGAGSLLRGVEGAEPAALLRLRVADLGSVTAPGTAANSTVAHGGAGVGGVTQGALRGTLLGVRV